MPKVLQQWRLRQGSWGGRRAREDGCTILFRSWRAISGSFAGDLLSFFLVIPHLEFSQASTIAGGWKGRRGRHQARKYSGWHSHKWAWKIPFCYFDDNSTCFVQDEKNLELLKSQQSGAGGANKDLRWDLEDWFYQFFLKLLSAVELQLQHVYCCLGFFTTLSST